METVIEILSAVGLALLGAVGVALRAWLAEKVKSELLKGGLLRVTDAALTAVQSVAQSYSDDLKAASADGKLTADERQAARDQALQRMKHLLGEAGLSEVQRVFGVYGASLDSALLDRIEATLKGLGK